MIIGKIYACVAFLESCKRQLDGAYEFLLLVLI